MPRALISVSDKRGVVALAESLAAMGWELVSTGGTATLLRDAGVPVTSVASVTGFPEILDGRVKTLHPAIHAGLLARGDTPGHLRQLEEHALQRFDLLVVNLYPFRATIAAPDVKFEDAIENIDIGGPSMLRSAAKNFEFVLPVVDPRDYTRVLELLRAAGLALDLLQRRLNADPEIAGVTADSRKAGPGYLFAALPGSKVDGREFAAKVFGHTAEYDNAIAGYLTPDRDTLPERVSLSMERQQVLRYGENPAQRAALYVTEEPRGIGDLCQRQGKELSFNNLLDIDAATLAVSAWNSAIACAIIKHTTPCGLALGRTVSEAFQRARATDPMSAFGSVVAFNTVVDRAAAEAMADLFVEVVVAPAFHADALAKFAEKKQLRVVELPAARAQGGIDWKRIRGGFLLQDQFQFDRSEEGWTSPTSRQPTPAERNDLRFAWAAVSTVKSNAIVLARDEQVIGIGAGQMSRVDASFLAVHKATAAGHPVAGAALASDGFFPFADGVEEAARAGVTSIIQPGGSVRDPEVIAAADRLNIAMILTGTRMFRH
ncbi:MAG: bifunctional phosphoribosylaminoimidazolecarboxamide formyltransferase/IMP cyclohydrolase [Gemmatimonadota bacterium]